MDEINTNNNFNKSEFNFSIREKFPLFNNEDSEYEYLSKKKNKKNKEEEENLSFEGIISKEPLSNQYEIIPYSSLDLFPNCLVGRIITKFLIGKTTKYQYGVAILIGPRIVLTVAHNLLIDGIKADKIFFCPISNGNFSLCDNIISDKFYIPNEFIYYGNINEKKEQLLYDWGLIFFNWDVGDYIINSVNGYYKDYNGYLKENSCLYQFFLNELNNNDNYDNENISKNILIILGYTSYDEALKFNDNNIINSNKNSFLRTKSHQMIHQSNKLLYNKIENSSINKQIQGKIFAELIDEINPLDNQFLNLNIENEIKENNINSLSLNEETKKENEYDTYVITKLFRKSFQKNKNYLFYETDYNIIPYILFDEIEKIKDIYNDNPDKDLVMTHSKGKVLSIISENKNNIIKYRITTYKGQSGSPIFLKDIKNNQLRFLGLHSRRGPVIDVLKIIKLYYNKKNLNRSFSYESSSLPKKNKFLENLIDPVNGVCDFNIALGFNKETILKISQICYAQTVPMFLSDYNIDSIYFNISLLIYKSNKVINGLFKRNLMLEDIFIISSKIIGIDVDYILLRDNTEMIYNYNFDKEKTLEEVFNYNNIVIEDLVYYQKFFEIGINIKAYCEDSSNEIISKFLSNNYIKINQLKENLSQHSILLFKSIFEHLSSIDCKLQIYGEIFKKIRKNILNKIENCR